MHHTPRLNLPPFMDNIFMAGSTGAIPALSLQCQRNLFYLSWPAIPIPTPSARDFPGTAGTRMWPLTACNRSQAAWVTQVMFCDRCKAHCAARIQFLAVQKFDHIWLLEVGKIPLFHALHFVVQLLRA